MMTQTGRARPTQTHDYRQLFTVDQQAPRLDGGLGPGSASQYLLKLIHLAADKLPLLIPSIPAAILPI